MTREALAQAKALYDEELDIATEEVIRRWAEVYRKSKLTQALKRIKDVNDAGRS